MVEVVIVDYQDVVSPVTTDRLREQISTAFGSKGVGLIGIRGIPNFHQAKMDLLSQAHALAHLPPDELKELEDPKSLYNSGWSHGKEKLKSDAPDWNKASFYFNPLVDVPGTKEDRFKYPLSYPCNKWPRKNTTLPNFESAAKRLGSLMKDVAVLLSKHIDDYAHSVNPSYHPQTLHDSLVNTEKAKGRLLYYYPLSEETANDSKSSSEDSWIGWHNDSGFLTCLSGDIFLTPDGSIQNTPPEEAGLYVVDRQDNVIQVRLPSDCMGIQIGECTQILTGGAVIATPHCVRGAPNVARAAMACFIDTPPSHVLSCPRVLSDDNNEKQNGISIDLLAKSCSRVPPLAQRWQDGMTFGEFLEKTFQMYYEFDTTTSATTAVEEESK